MTIQEYKDALENWGMGLNERGMSADALVGAQLMADYAVEVARTNLLRLEANLDVSKLEDGKCYMVSFDPRYVTPMITDEWTRIYNEAVVDRGIKFLLKFNSTQIKEVDNAE